MGLLTPVALRVAKISWMPKLLPQIVWTDETLQRLSGGRVSVLDIAGLPNLNLTVVGRKSGLPRTTPLLCVPDGEVIYIAGSYFGGPKMPLWVYNLRAAEGRAEVEFKRQKFAVHATELEGTERAEAREIVLRTWPVFEKYEERTDRTIPIFGLVRA